MNDDTKVYSAAIWTVKHGNEEAFTNAWEDFARWSFKNVPGGISVQLLKSEEDPRKFVTIGPWKDALSLTSWRAMPEFRQFFGKAKELCEDIRPMTLRVIFSL